MNLETLVAILSDNSGKYFRDDRHKAKFILTHCEKPSVEAVKPPESALLKKNALADAIDRHEKTINWLIRRYTRTLPGREGDLRSTLQIRLIELFDKWDFSKKRGSFTKYANTCLKFAAIDWCTKEIEWAKMAELENEDVQIND